MSDKYELSANHRLHLGKGASRRMRRMANEIPAVVYGAGKAPAAITLSGHQLNNALKHEGFYSHILTLKLGNGSEKVVLKDLHRHPSKPQILHADFLRVSATEKLYMQIPLHFLNEDSAPGVKLEGGKVSRLMNEVEVSCFPADLPEFIEVDLAALNLNESIHLSALQAPKGVEFVALAHGDDRAVVNIHTITVVEEPEVTPASAEVPVIGEEGEGGESAEREATGE